MQPGMNFYSQLPDSYTLVVNVKHPVIESVIKDAEAGIGSEINASFAKLSETEEKLKDVNAKVKDGKPDETQQKEISELQEQMGNLRAEMSQKASEYGAGQPKVRQVIDLALLASGLLKGKELNEFVKRSVSLL